MMNQPLFLEGRRPRCTAVLSALLLAMQHSIGENLIPVFKLFMVMCCPVTLLLVEVMEALKNPCVVAIIDHETAKFVR